eukprot:12918149-Alexandrium_andersonii.AAC.1
MFEASRSAFHPPPQVGGHSGLALPSHHDGQASSPSACAPTGAPSGHCHGQTPSSPRLRQHLHKAKAHHI